VFIIHPKRTAIPSDCDNLICCEIFIINLLSKPIYEISNNLESLIKCQSFSYCTCREKNTNPQPHSCWWNPHQPKAWPFADATTTSEWSGVLKIPFSCPEKRHLWRAYHSITMSLVVQPRHRWIKQNKKEDVPSYKALQDLEREAWR